MSGAPALLASFGSEFDRLIVEPGRLPAFIFLVVFLGTFAFIRTSAHMIRAQVSWWPGNVEVGGTHIHHLVWGIIVMMLSGWVAIAIDPGPPGREIAAVFFGIGAGLTLDEFALWLELEDVYWSEDGRKSIDAVIVAGILAGFGVLGLSVWADAAHEVEAIVHAIVGAFGLFGLLMAVLCFLKEKFVIGAIALLLPPVGLIGALRLARPGSPWAKVLYGEQKRERAEQRFAHRGLPLKRGETTQEAGSASAPEG